MNKAELDKKAFVSLLFWERMNVTKLLGIEKSALTTPAGPHELRAALRMGKENSMECPECGEELDYLDTVVEKATGRIAYILYICHNEDCECEGWIYHDRNGNPVRGDPSGCY